MQKNESIVEDIKHLKPDVIINDRLDTEASYITDLKSLGMKVINFEDLGTGAKEADLVINAIYPEKEILPNHYYGHDYFVLRDEFTLSTPEAVSKEVKNVLLTFGGVDPNNYTLKVLESIYAYCVENGINISVIAGFGYQHYESLVVFKEVAVYKNATDIAEHMKKSNLIFTSAGRTTYEIACLNIPAIVLVQNERERSHFFASEEYGFTNLGLGYAVTNEEILNVFLNLTGNYEARKQIGLLMAKTDLHSGRYRTLKLIKSVVEGA